jgi:hypothetical protein
MTDAAQPLALDDVTQACLQLIGKTGARDFQLRWSDDRHPLVWIAVAEYESTGTEVVAATGGLTPREAIYRLVEALMDGGVCTHCSRPTGVSDDFKGTMPLEAHICWYRYDPECKVFRRGCE